MITINGISLPDWLVVELASLVNGVPDAQILHFSKSETSLGRGLRPTISNAVQMKKRLLAQIVTGRDSASPVVVKKTIVEFLRSQSLDQQLLVVLSQSFITEYYPVVLAHYGVGKVLMASTLSARPAVRMLAEPYLLADALPDTVSSDELNTRLVLRLKPLMDIVGEHAEQEVPYASAAVDKTAPTLDRVEDKKSADEVQRLAQQVNKRQRQIDKLEKQLDQAEVKHQKEIKRSAELRVQLRDARASVIELENTLSDAQRLYKRDVSDKVRKTNSRIARYWLQGPTATRSLAIDSEDLPLLDTINNVLEKQASQDRNYGNRTVLANEANKLLQGINDIEDALVNSLVPLHELTTIRDAAKQRLMQINSQLDPLANAEQSDRDLSALLRKMAAKVKTADSEQERQELLAVAQTLFSQNILSEKSVASLHNTQTIRLEIEQELHESALRADTIKPAAAKSKKTHFRRGSARYQIALAEHSLVIIDGHNLLLGVSRITRLFGSKAQAASPKARQWLVETSGRLLGEELDSDAIVMFDGDSDSEESYNTRLRVIYASGGMKRGSHANQSGSQRADDHIIQYIDSMLNYSANKEQQALFLVTDDKELQSRAQGREIDVIDATLYGDWCLQLLD